MYYMFLHVCVSIHILCLIKFLCGVCMYASACILKYLKLGNTTYECFPLVAINVKFNTIEYNVSESEETVVLNLVANETSEFDYTVTVMLTDISTGKQYYILLMIAISCFRKFTTIP